MKNHINIFYKRVRHGVTVTALLPLMLMLAVDCQATVFKVATLSPDGSSWMKTMRAAAGEVEQATDGRVKFKFYPGGVMGNDEAVMRKIRFGQLQGGAVPGGALTSVYPDVQIYGLPLKFKSFDEVDYVRERMDQQIIDGIEEGGFVTFGLGEGGFAYVLSQEPISSTAGLKAHKVWIPNNDEAALLAVRAFGVSPIPLNLSDVLAGLQTGLVDTVATSPIGAIALHWHTQVKYMSDLPIMYFFAVLALDKKVFDRLSEEDQAVVRSKMEAAFQAIDKQNRVDNVDAHQALIQQGINLVPIADAEREQWYQAADRAQREMVDKDVVSRAAVEQLDGLLEAYRALPAGQ